VLDGESGELRTVGLPAASDQLLGWLRTFPAAVRVAYQTGPTGFELARACAGSGITCLVAAPGKIPRAPAERDKTGRRDAERLARLLRLGELTSVRVPSEFEEAARDLARAREDARAALMRARHRLSKLLLRHGLLCPRSAWTREHDRWLRGLRSNGCLRSASTSYGGVLEAKARRDRLDHTIAEVAAAPPYREIVARLSCLRGVSTLTALALTVELGDWQRFDPPGSARSSGWCRASSAASSAARADQQDRQRPRPPAARRSRLAPTAAPRPSLALVGRRGGQSAPVRSEAEAIARRLHRRWWDLGRRGKRRTIVVVAVACELARLSLEADRHVVQP
jgi:transposase